MIAGPRAKLGNLERTVLVHSTFILFVMLNWPNVKSNHRQFHGIWIGQKEKYP